jgi:hypothetical protein
MLAWSAENREAVARFSGLTSTALCAWPGAPRVPTDVRRFVARQPDRAATAHWSRAGLPGPRSASSSSAAKTWTPSWVAIS